jgi:fatty acid-binding protein DegV
VDRTLLLTDSNVCLPRATTRRLRIRIVPITILLDGASAADDSIDPAVVFDAIARDDTVKSSPPSVIDYLTAIEDDGYSGALVLTPAAEFTSMFLHATQAAELASRPVRVVDTRTAAAAQRLVVLEVAHACGRGAGLEDLEQIARDAAGRVELVATLDRVATIERSGRVPAPVLAAAERGDGFSAFRFRDGRVMPLRSAGVDPLAVVHDAWVRSGGPDSSASCVFHAGVPGRARALRARLSGTEPVIPFSPAMAIHTGPGVVGVAWLRPAAPGEPASEVG